VEAISLILAALGAGAAKGVSESAVTAVSDACSALREALRRRLGGEETPVAHTIERYATAPDSWRGILETELQVAGAGEDTGLMLAAEAVMRHADPAGTATGKYVVNLTGASGVQVGDGNTQTNYFDRPS
jgi:hypothetical protein